MGPPRERLGSLRCGSRSQPTAALGRTLAAREEVINQRVALICTLDLWHMTAGVEGQLLGLRKPSAHMTPEGWGHERVVTSPHKQRGWRQVRQARVEAVSPERCF